MRKIAKKGMAKKGTGTRTALNFDHELPFLAPCLSPLIKFMLTGHTLFDLITKACKLMSDEKPCLLDRHLHERTITGRITHYLQPLVPEGYFVDCEYNKMGDEEGRNVKKMLSNYPKDRVYPDIIIHKRTKGTADNLAVIEAKWQVSERQEINETEKVKFYLKEPLLLYKYGFLLVLDGVEKGDRHASKKGTEKGDRHADGLEFRFSFAILGRACPLFRTQPSSPSAPSGQPWRSK